MADDPRLPQLLDPGDGDGLDIPIAQMSFDPLSVTVMPERVAESKQVLVAALQTLARANDDLASRTSAIATLEARLGAFGARTRKAIERAARARERLRHQAVLAYTSGRGDLQLSVVNMTNAIDVGVAKQYMGALMDNQERLARDYEDARRDLSRSQADLAEHLGLERAHLVEAKTAVEEATEGVEAAKEQLAAYEAGAHAYISGFVFPLASEAEFIDSWGYPRMMGTPSAHWHQGTDIFAPYGAPAIASENGVIDRLGQASLGGNKLWVKGESGTSYYYAHLSAFAEGLANGQHVRAGQVVGYVGDTGNAKGTSPHLHFEIHPAGSSVVNGYPLLRAAYGNRPKFTAVVAPPTTQPPAVPVADDRAGAGAAPNASVAKPQG